MMGQANERSIVNEQPDERGLAPEAPVIESASGTTDPRNSESGPTAYVVFGVVVALLVLLAMSFSSCSSALGSIASSSRLWDDAWTDDDWDGDWGDGWDEGYGTGLPWAEDGHAAPFESPYDA